MSPLPLSTTTLNAHGAGRVAPRRAATRRPAARRALREHDRERRGEHGEPTAPTAAILRHGFDASGIGGTGRPASSQRLAVVDAERGRVEHGREQGAVAASGSGRGVPPRATRPVGGRARRGARPRRPSAAGAARVRERRLVRRRADADARACAQAPGRCRAISVRLTGFGVPFRTSSAKSTSPGGVRSSQATRRASSAARAFVRNSWPGGRASSTGCSRGAAVGGRDDVAALVAPRGDHAVDRARIELGPVGEHDDRRLCVRRQRREPAAQRSPGPALPLGAADRLRRRSRRRAPRARRGSRPATRLACSALEHPAGAPPASAAQPRTGTKRPPPTQRPRSHAPPCPDPKRPAGHVAKRSLPPRSERPRAAGAFTAQPRASRRGPTGETGFPREASGAKR